MKTSPLLRGTVLALALAAGGSAFAQDHYARLFEMRQMDANKDGMVSKEEFLAMVAKMWDMHAAQARGGMLDAAQLRSLQRVLGRTLSAQAGA